MAQKTNLEQYRSTASGVETPAVDVASDEHALKAALGNDEDAKKMKYDPAVAGERFVQWYDDTAASIREYLSNSETACIRRARQELLSVDEDAPAATRELFEKAKKVCGYEPIIEVTYRHSPEATRLVIEDNGIGISIDEYHVLRNIGYSTSHSAGDRLGQFGMGFMSGFMLVDVTGSFRMYTNSFVTEENYSLECNVDKFEPLDGLRSGYGTRFEFPTFCADAEDIDIRQKVAEFADGMRVPVLYREFDRDGDEFYNEDYLPTNLEDHYADDSMLVVYEDEFFKAVASPDSPEGRAAGITYNISMPIDRNDGSYRRTNSFKSPWTFDVRVKAEDGPIVASEDESLIGLKPLDDSKYVNLEDDRKKSQIRKSEVPDDAIVMPRPASSRDTYMSGHQDFWTYVSSKVRDAWGEIAAESFEKLQSWDDYEAMNREEKAALMRAYSEFGPYGDRIDVGTVQKTIEKELGVTPPTEVARRLPELKRTITYVNNGTRDPDLKRGRGTRTAWKFLDEHGSNVFMGVSISRKRAALAWDLGAEIVHVDSSGKYTLFEDLWGWKKLKDLPYADLSGSDYDFSDEVIEKWESDDSSASSARTRASGDGQDPTTADVKVRSGKHHRTKYTIQNASTLKNRLSSGESIDAGKRSAKYLVLVDDDKTVTRAVKHVDNRKGIAVARVPQYVYRYLVDCDNVYESKRDCIEDNEDVELEDGVMLSELSSDDLVLCYDGDTYTQYSPDELVVGLDLDRDDYDRVYMIDSEMLQEGWGVDTDATIYSQYGSYRFDRDDVEKNSPYNRDLIRRIKTSEFDHSSPEYKALFRSNSYSDDELFHLVNIWNRIDADSKDSQEWDDMFGHRYNPGPDKVDRLVEIADKAGL